MSGRRRTDEIGSGHGPTDSGWIGAGADDHLDRWLEELEEPFDRRRPHVMTALGPVEPADLGVTVVDEVRSGDLADPGRPASLPAVHRDLAALDAFHAVGGGAVARVCETGCLRDPQAAWLATRSPVHLILGAAPHDDRGAVARFGAAVERMAESITAAIVGRARSEEMPLVRAGAIVVELEAAPVTARNRTGLVAAALACRATGAPVVIVAVQAAAATAGAKLLRDEGVAPGRIALRASIGTGPDREWLGAAADGSYLIVSDVLGESVAETGRRAAAIRSLVEAGLGERLVLGTTRSLGAGPAPASPPEPADLVERLPLALMERGLEAETVRRLLIDNPARLLTLPGVTS